MSDNREVYSEEGLQKFVFAFFIVLICLALALVAFNYYCITHGWC